MREFTDQELVRREKMNEISNITNPYPERYETNYEIKDAANLEDGTKDVSVAGRIVLMRKMGKLSFLTIQDIEGKIQVSIKIDLVGEERYEQFKNIFDLGDFIGVRGEIFTTHTGEKTVRADTFEFLGKALRPLPEKFHGLSDQEMCYRNRYVDLITNEDSRKTFIFRSAFIKSIREYLGNLGYIEIETPILTNKPSGALARPFITHHNALDQDCYLRIAPETYLKRAIVGGFTKVFEVARVFRNEGMDTSHLQDFTMIEGYQAYFNYKDNMRLIENMLKTIIKDLFGTLEIKIVDKMINLDQDWKTVSFRDLVLEYSGIDIDNYKDKESLLKIIKEKKLDLDSETPIENMGYGNILDQLYKKTARPNIIDPIFLVEHPIELSPLARANDDNPRLTDRFHLIINGQEMINAYSELVDPIEQERRLLAQAELKFSGDEEAMPMDYDYIEAMEYGMPPISGWGMGVDRIVQVLTDSFNIRDVVLFPLMKPID